MSDLYNSTGYPLYNGKIINSQGCYIYDDKGNTYLDFESGVWCLPLGHKHPKIISAMYDQINRLSHVGYKYNDEIVEKAAEKLIQISGFSSAKCVFLSSGSEAVEYGIKMAKALRPNKKCICLANQYFSAYGSASNLSSTEWVRIPWDHKENKSVEEWTSMLISLIDFQQIGVFVFDAGNTSGLVKLPPHNLVSAISRLLEKVDAITVVDEITCGIGRTGNWFGYMNYNLTPDIVAVGKGLGNGYPVSAVIIKENLTENATQLGFHYGQSHQNDPLGSRIAYEVINTIEEEHLLENTITLGKYFRDGYSKIMASYNALTEVRGIGFLNSLQFSDRINPEQLMELDKQLFENGFIVGMKPKEKVLRTYNPLITEAYMIDHYLEVLEVLLRKLSF